MTTLRLFRVFIPLAILATATACSVTADETAIGRIESPIPTPRWDDAWQTMQLPVYDAHLPAGAGKSPPAIWTNGTETHAFTFINQVWLAHSRWNGTSWVTDDNPFLVPQVVPGTKPAVILNGDTFEIYYADFSHDLVRVKFTRSTNTWFWSPRYEVLQLGGIIGVTAANMRWLVPSGSWWKFVNRTDLFILREGGAGSAYPSLPSGNLEQWTQIGTDPMTATAVASGATSMPSAVSWGNGRIDLVYRMDDPSRPGVSRVAHKSWASSRCSTGSCWSANDYVDVDATAAPAIAAAGANNLLLLTESAAGVEARFGDGATWGSARKIADCVHGNPFLEGATDGTVPPAVDAAEKVRYTTPSAAGAAGTFFASVWGANSFVFTTMYRNAEPPTTIGAQPPCLPCKAEGAACCTTSTGATCDAGFVCKTDGTCTACGAVSQVCCGTTCNAGAVCGTDGKCRTACGDIGQACCGSTTCNSGLRCWSGSCVNACGQGGQACCGGTTCDAGFLCSGAGTCTACGGIGQQCCAGSTCSGSALCGSSNTCVDTQHFAPIYAMLPVNNCTGCHASTYNYPSTGSCDASGNHCVKGGICSGTNCIAPPFYNASNANGTRDALTSLGLVLPYNSAGSPLWQSLKDGRMPKDMTPPLFNAADLAIIARWIDNGAPY